MYPLVSLLTSQLCRLPDMVNRILDGLCPFVVELCADVNGNHVIKCCLKSMAAELRQRLLDEVVDHCIEVEPRRGVESRSARRCTAARSFRNASRSRRERAPTACSTPSRRTRSISCAIATRTTSSKFGFSSPFIVVPNRKRAAERVAAVLPLRSHTCGGTLQGEMQQQCRREESQSRRRSHARFDYQRDRERFGPSLHVARSCRRQSVRSFA